MQCAIYHINIYRIKFIFFLLIIPYLQGFSQIQRIAEIQVFIKAGIELQTPLVVKNNSPLP